LLAKASAQPTQESPGKLLSPASGFLQGVAILAIITAKPTSQFSIRPRRASLVNDVDEVIMGNRFAHVIIESRLPGFFLVAGGAVTG
jgi:hypothetical protein